MQNITKPMQWQKVDDRRLERLIEDQGLFKAYCICVENFYKIDGKREKVRELKYGYAIDYLSALLEGNKIEEDQNLQGQLF